MICLTGLQVFPTAHRTPDVASRIEVRVLMLIWTADATYGGSRAQISGLQPASTPGIRPFQQLNVDGLAVYLDDHDGLAMLDPHPR